ncbi:MAG TPA: BON domain-containing protein [Verrucomicrobiae bacterium]|jgi:osmotically-inducible protein OsmY|nr:BON domain-containing protein [Verrucomicrobiae bacterium]
MKRTVGNWKDSLKRPFALVCVGLAPILAGYLVTGCAGDRYHESTGESIDDTATTARVKDALGKDSQFKYDDVHVTTFKGTVQLSGFVASEDAKKHAEELAKNTDGVQNVQDEISLK